MSSTNNMRSKTTTRSRRRSSLISRIGLGLVLSSTVSNSGSSPLFVSATGCGIVETGCLTGCTLGLKNFLAGFSGGAATTGTQNFLKAKRLHKKRNPDLYHEETTCSCLPLCGGQICGGQIKKDKWEETQRKKQEKINQLRNERIQEENELEAKLEQLLKPEYYLEDRDPQTGRPLTEREEKARDRQIKNLREELEELQSQPMPTLKPTKTDFDLTSAVFLERPHVDYDFCKPSLKEGDDETDRPISNTVGQACTFEIVKATVGPGIGGGAHAAGATGCASGLGALGCTSGLSCCLPGCFSCGWMTGVGCMHGPRIIVADQEKVIEDAQGCLGELCAIQ